MTRHPERTTTRLSSYGGSHASDLDAYLAVLTGTSPAGRLIEIRYWDRRVGMRQQFVSAHHRDLAAAAVTSLAPHADVYVGVLLRTRRAGGRDAISDSHLAFVEIDQPDATDRLARFAREPTMVVASGTDGHVHSFWELHQPVAAALLPDVNRRLARELGGDLASVDATRILRPPLSLNHKHSPPAAVTLVELDRSRRYELADLVDSCRTVPAHTTSPGTPQRVVRAEPEDWLLRIPTADYVKRLTGREPSRSGKVRCPFHEPDSTPSLHCYPDGTWFCFGCRAGGSIFDFGARVWRMGTRGRDFIELRARLVAEFGRGSS